MTLDYLGARKTGVLVTDAAGRPYVMPFADLAAGPGGVEGPPGPQGPQGVPGEPGTDGVDGDAGPRVVTVVFDGGGAVLVPGSVAYLSCPLTSTIISWRLLADTPGAVQIDVWKDTYANHPPTDADSMTAGNEPEILASGVAAEDTDLSDWSSVAVVAGNVLALIVSEVNGAEFGLKVVS